VAGNGNSQNNSNALTLLKNGNLMISGSLSQGGDLRLKQNIKPLSNVLLKLKNIQPVSFSWKDINTYDEDKHIGIIAQELQKEYPELVTQDLNGYLNVEYSALSSLLLQALNEQQNKVKALEDKISALEDKTSILGALKTEFEEQKKSIQLLLAGIN
jgi:hypothetical protein